MGDCKSSMHSSKPSDDSVIVWCFNSLTCRSEAGLFKNDGLLLCIEHKQEPVEQSDSPCHSSLQNWLWLLRQDLHPGYVNVSSCLLLPQLPVVLSGVSLLHDLLLMPLMTLVLAPVPWFQGSVGLLFRSKLPSLVDKNIPHWTVFKKGPSNKLGLQEFSKKYS